MRLLNYDLENLINYIISDLELNEKLILFNFIFRKNKPANFIFNMFNGLNIFSNEYNEITKKFFFLLKLLLKNKKIKRFRNKIFKNTKKVYLFNFR